MLNKTSFAVLFLAYVKFLGFTQFFWLPLWQLAQLEGKGVSLPSCTVGTLSCSPEQMLIIIIFLQTSLKIKHAQGFCFHFRYSVQGNLNMPFAKYSEYLSLWKKSNLSPFLPFLLLSLSLRTVCFSGINSTILPNTHASSAFLLHSRKS